MESLLFVFVDGLGVAPRGPSNPLGVVPMPAWEEWLGGPATTETFEELERNGAPDLVVRRIDATLGVDGLPQSATGQTSLLTGVNAATLLGRHVPALPGESLRRLLEERSVFREFSPRDAAFANAFSAPFFRLLEQGGVSASVSSKRRRRRPSASVLAARAGGVGFRGEGELAEGRAVCWDITGEAFGVALSNLRRKRFDPATLGPARMSSVEAGRRLVEIASAHRFTLFETFLTDLAGHGRYVIDAERALSRLDGLVAGIRDAVSVGARPLTVLLTSDHGNVEDLSAPTHTRNSVPLIAFGAHAERFRQARAIDHVGQCIRQWSQRERS